MCIIYVFICTVCTDVPRILHFSAFIIASCYFCQQQDVRDLVKTARELAKEPFTYLHRPRPLVPAVPAVPDVPDVPNVPIHYPSLTIGSSTHYSSSTVGSSTHYSSSTVGSSTHYSSSTVGSRRIPAEYYDVREELYLFLMLTCILIYDLRHLGELENI